MELRNMITFVQVAEHGSFTKAAEYLGYTQSTVSFQIRQLEEELNCSLFDRFNHCIALTDKGLLLKQYALEVLRSNQEFLQNFAGEEEPRGKVHIATSDSICEKMMLKNYRDFYAHYPYIQLEFTTHNTEDMMYMLDHNEADVIFTIDRHVYRNDYIIAKEEEVEMHFVTRADSPLLNREVSIEEVIEYPFLLTESGMSYRRLLHDRLEEKSLEITPVLEIGRTDLLTSCLEAGGGISFLPEFVTREKVKEGKLAYLQVKDFDFTVWKQLMYHKDKWLSRSLSAFIEYVKEHEFNW